MKQVREVIDFFFNLIVHCGNEESKTHGLLYANNDCFI